MKKTIRFLALLLVMITICSTFAVSVSATSGASSSTVVTTTSPVSGSFVRIRYSGNGRYLDVPAEGINKDGTQLQIWDHTPGNTNQIFQLIDTGKGWQIISLQSEKVIEVRDSSHDDYAQVAQWTEHDGACARWDIVKYSDGSVAFRNRESGKFLNVCGGGNAGNGTKLIQYYDDKSSAMRFFIEPVTTCDYSTTAGTIPSSAVKQEKNLSVRSWHPLNGLTETMLGQEAIPEELEVELSAGAEDFNTVADVIDFILSWIFNSSEYTRIHVTEGTNGQISIRYGTSIEQLRSGQTISLFTMLTQAHPGEAAYVLWAARDADECIRNWFGLSGDGKYSMWMNFGKVAFGDFGYALIIENGAIRQTPLIHPDSTYDVYYEDNNQMTHVMDVAEVLRKVKIPMADDAARTVMLQLVTNGYVDSNKVTPNVASDNQPAVSTLGISVTSHPTSIKEGSAWGMRGSVTSNYKIIQVDGSVCKYNEKGELGSPVMSSVDYPNTTSMDIRYSQVNNALVFNDLPTGKYRLLISATDCSGAVKHWGEDFEVYGETSSLKIDWTRYPEELDKGKCFGLRGSITSNYIITEVRGFILGSGGVVDETVDYPNAYSFDIQYGNINNYLEFNKLPCGTYSLQIEARDASGKIQAIVRQFVIKEEVVASSLNIDWTRYPEELNKGKCFGLRGTITSNYIITEVRGFILGSNGVVDETVDYPNAYSFDIRYGNINNYLEFNKLPRGTYSLQIEARDASGRIETIVRQFTIK